VFLEYERPGKALEPRAGACGGGDLYDVMATPCQAALTR
jgi:hypothetical protein